VDVSRFFRGLAGKGQLNLGFWGLGTYGRVGFPWPSTVVVAYHDGGLVAGPFPPRGVVVWFFRVVLAALVMLGGRKVGTLLSRRRRTDHRSPGMIRPWFGRGLLSWCRVMALGGWRYRICRDGEDS
jgi:hypothetical protein